MLVRFVCFCIMFAFVSNSYALTSNSHVTRKFWGSVAVVAIGAAAFKGVCTDSSGKVKAKCIPKKAETSDAVDVIINPDDPNYLRSGATAKLRRNLISEQALAGFPPDPDDCDAHHIVPKAEGRTWAREHASNARKILEECNIDLDSSENGVYLPAKRDTQSCNGSYHKTLHTKKYYADVNKRLELSKPKGCSAIRSTLQRIKDDLIKGNY